MIGANIMDFGNMLEDSFFYTKEALWGRWERWLLLIISYIVFPLGYGYSMRIARGENPAPEVGDWVNLFIDGLKLFLVMLIYLIPIAIAWIVLVGGLSLLAYLGDPMTSLAAAAGALIGFAVAFALTVIIGLIATMGAVRFSRKNDFGEAFNIRAIMAHIGKIGWSSYILALGVLIVALFIGEMVLAIIPLLGWLILFLLSPAFAIFTARYITQIYDSVSS
jgi:hypothetical protein